MPPDARIVVVEKSDWLRRLLTTGLRDHGFEVTSARSGDEALEHIHMHSPDCIVCGLKVEGADGYWLVTRIREEIMPISATPVLFIGEPDEPRGRSAQDGRLRALESGADAFVTKPFRIDELVAQVRALIERHRRSAPAKVSAPRATPSSISGGNSGGISSGISNSARSSSSPPTSAEANLRGDLEQMSLVSLLTLLEMERRSGRVTVRAEGLRAIVDVASGFASVANINGRDVDPVAIVRASFDWGAGRIAFRASAPKEASAGAAPLRVLLAEARQVDKQTRGAAPALRRGLDEAPTRKVDGDDLAPISTTPASSQKRAAESTRPRGRPSARPSTRPKRNTHAPPAEASRAADKEPSVATRQPPRGRIPAAPRPSRPPKR